MTDMLRAWVAFLRSDRCNDMTIAQLALANEGCISDDIEVAANEIERLNIGYRELIEEREIKNREIARLREALKRKDVLIEKLHIVAKNMTHVLQSFTAGGSEFCTRVLVDDFEDYYADADACQRVIRERLAARVPISSGKQT